MTAAVLAGLTGCARDGSSGAAPSAPPPSPASSTTQSATQSHAPSTSATSAKSATATAGTTIRAATPAAFHTPTGSIACVGTQDSLRCDVKDFTYAVPSGAARGCELDVGSALVIEKHRAALGCVSDSVLEVGAVDASAAPERAWTSWWHQGLGTTKDGKYAVVPYGSTIVMGAFSCAISTQGVDCAESGAGAGSRFHLSREAFTLGG
jgi:hypothetical protein